MNKLKVSVMFDNHTFDSFTGTADEIYDWLNNLYDETFVFPDGFTTTGDKFIAGWGKVRFVEDPENYILTEGLLKRKDLHKLKNLEPDILRCKAKILDQISILKERIAQLEKASGL